MCQTGILSPDPLLYLLIHRPVTLNIHNSIRSSGVDDFYPTVTIKNIYEQVLRVHGIADYQKCLPLASGLIKWYKKLDPDSSIVAGIAPSGNDLTTPES